MKNLLSKTLVCGVLATSFLLINCQKAPTRGLKAGVVVDPKASQIPLKTAPCTDNEITKFDAAKEAVKALEALTKKDKPSEADKQEMSAKLTELEAKIKASQDAISALKVGNDAADACSKPNKEDPAKPEILKADEFKGAFLKLKGVIKDLGATVPPADPVNDPVVEVLKSKDRIELSADLISYYNDSASGCISGGEFRTSEECGQLRADSTVCKVTRDKSVVEANAKAEIMVGEFVPNAAPKRNSLKITVNIEAADGARVTFIDCDLAAGITAEKAPEAVTRALGKLVTKIAAKESAADEAKTDETNPEPAASVPADDELANRAQAALPLLDDAPVNTADPTPSAQPTGIGGARVAPGSLPPQ